MDVLDNFSPFYCENIKSTAWESMWGENGQKFEFRFFTVRFHDFYIYFKNISS